MPLRSNVVSICPWFKVHPGKLSAFQALLPRLIEKTSAEAGCLFYDFTRKGDIIHCREAYLGAEGAMAHLQNVGPIIAEALTLSDIQRLEVHGSAAELEKMREPLKDMPIEWFVLEAALEK